MTTTIPWVLSPDGSPGESWNPTVACSNTCDFCYMRPLHNRRFAAGMKGYERPFNEPRMMPERLSHPLKRRKPTGWFVDSAGDLFDPAIPSEYIAAVFGVMAACPQHRFYVLTKRAKRMEEWFGWLGKQQTEDGIYDLALSCAADRIEARTWERAVISAGLERSLPECEPWPLPNVWIGVSVTDQRDADERIPLLLRCPAALRFVSVEPMLGEVEIRNIETYLQSGELDSYHNPLTGHAGFHAGGWFEASDWPRIGWVIAGGQTGPDARPCHPDWVRGLRDQCRAAGVPFFFKQVGEWSDVGPLSVPQRVVCGQCGWSSEITDGALNEHYRATGHRGHYQAMYRVGTRAAGHLLDGREWREVPHAQ